MKKLLQFIFFPLGVDYPPALIYHLILGGFLAFGIVMAASGPAAASSYTTGIVGPVLGLVAGLLVWLANHDDATPAA